MDARHVSRRGRLWVQSVYSFRWTARATSMALALLAAVQTAVASHSSVPEPPRPGPSQDQGKAEPARASRPPLRAPNPRGSPGAGGRAVGPDSRRSPVCGGWDSRGEGLTLTQCDPCRAVPVSASRAAAGCSCVPFPSTWSGGGFREVFPTQPAGLDEPAGRVRVYTPIE